MSSNAPLVPRENIFGSRKTAGFVIMVLSVIALVYVTTKLGTPPEIANSALYVIALGGLFTMGGQALVDSVAKWRVFPDPPPAPKVEAQTVNQVVAP